MILRQCEEKIGAEHFSKNLTRNFLFNMPGIRIIDDPPNLSSSSSDSDDDLDLDFRISQLIGNINDKRWDFEADVLAAFEKNNELYFDGCLCSL